MPGKSLQAHLDRLDLTIDQPPDAASWRLFVESAQQDLAQYQALFEQNNDGIALLRLDGIIVDANPRLTAIIGWSREALIGKPLFYFLHPEDIKQSRIDLEEMQHAGAARVHEQTLRRADDEVITLEISSRVVSDDAGNPRYIQSLVRDITHRKAWEQSLARSQHQLNHLIHTLPVGVALLGPQSNVLMANPAAHELLGLTEDQFMGKTSFDPDWNVIHPDGSPFPGITHPVPQSIATGLAVTDVVMGVYRPVRRDRIWLLVNATPELTDGRVTQVLCTYSDITQQVVAEQRERDLVVQHRIIETMRSLLRSIAHDLRTPLTVIKTSLYLLRDSVTGRDEMVQRRLANIETQSQRLHWIVDEAVEMARLDSGEVEFRFLPAQINSIISDAFIKLEGSFKVRQQRLQLRLYPNLPVAKVDRLMLGKAIENLLWNAYEYTPEQGEIEVVTERLEQGIQITIRDQGRGIGAQDLPHIFDRFYKGDEARTSGGSGLGLSIVRKIVEAHQGRISVESELGQGSCFTLWLPLRYDWD